MKFTYLNDVILLYWTFEISINSAYYFKLLYCRVVYAFGGEIKEQVWDITPTYLSHGVLGLVRECDHIAHTILHKSGMIAL